MPKSVEPDPAKIAKRIRDHNLRALLLRLAAGEEWRDTPTGVGPRLCNRPLAAARRTGLAAFPEGMEGMWAMLQLTPTGREVVEHLHPAKWTAAFGRSWGPRDRPEVSRPDGSVAFFIETFDEAQRIVDLLNADDLAKAKRYEAKS